jgi:hypothetical protein
VNEYADQPECTDTCVKSVNASNFTLLSQTRALDSALFCFQECRPSAEVQGSCELGRLTKDAKRAKGNSSRSSQNAQPPRANRPVKRVVLNSQDTSVGSQARLEPGQGARSEDLFKGSSDHLALAAEAERTATNTLGGAERIEAFSKKAAKFAEEKATRASLLAQSARELVVIDREGADESAHTVMESTIKSVVDAAHKAAEAKFKAAGEKLGQEMKAAAPAAGLKAMKPYMDGMTGAAKNAGEWVKQGDAASGLSFQLGLAAGFTMQQANQWNALGDFPRAQSMIRQSMETNEAARGLAGAAQGAYDTAAGITSHLLDYVPMAGAAQYHAEYMLNPEMPPPAAFTL